MSTLVCGFIGLGLIGGSIAKALRLRLPDTRLIAYDVNSASLELAKERNTINEQNQMRFKTNYRQELVL